MATESDETPLDVWQRIATWWDAQIGEGNDFQKQLIMPATDRLLAIRPGERVIDACCGNGNYTRRLANAGAHVLAFDGAADFLQAACRRSASAGATPINPAPQSPPTELNRVRSYLFPSGAQVDYLKVDATDFDAMIAAQGDAKFDAAVCSMAVMDLPTIAPLLRAIHVALKPNVGRFVFSVPHPCFNSPYTRMSAELQQINGEMRQTFDVRIADYLNDLPTTSSGIINQPEPHAFYHRPISKLLSECFAAGFVVTGMEEPSFPKNVAAKSAFSWGKRPQIPAALVVRLQPV